jgi:hypothetical protein
MDIVLVTPCCRPHNLARVAETIDFDAIHHWIIVYDTTRSTYDNQFDTNPKVTELRCSGRIYGNPQRNCALDHIQTFANTENIIVYFLDDDNAVHPEFWKIAKSFEPGLFYTWDQKRTADNVVKGGRCAVNSIDTAMFAVPINMIGNTRWAVDRYEADGIFIREINSWYPDQHTYLPVVACYYNATV